MEKTTEDYPHLHTNAVRESPMELLHRGKDPYVVKATERVKSKLKHRCYSILSCQNK